MFNSEPVSTITCLAAFVTFELARLAGRPLCVYIFKFVVHVPIIKSRNMFSDPIWPHSIYLIWQLERNLPLPSNTVAMAFVEAIQTLQLIGKRDGNWEPSKCKTGRATPLDSLAPQFVCSLVLIFLCVDLFVASLTLLTFPNPALDKTPVFLSFWGCWDILREKEAEVGQIWDTN